MNSNECNVARDLMPLCIDQVASGESRALVEAHTSVCEPCAQVYADMQARTPEKKDVAEEASFAAAMRQLRRTVVWRRIRLIVSSVIITLLLLAAGMWGIQFLLVEYNRDMPLDWYNMTLSRTKDGTGLVTIDYIKGYEGGVWAQSDPHTGVVILGSRSPIIPLKSYERKKESKYTYQPGIRWKDGVGFIFVGDDSAGDAADAVVKEIRMGSKDDYRILYQQGEEVPFCSDELESIAQLERKHADALEAANDAYLELVAFYDSIGP